jgi:predicted transposase/invertase (TIGR01784 family)
LAPQTLDAEEPIRAAVAIANTAALSMEELEAQEKRHDFIRLQRGWRKKAYSEGRQEGLQEGLQDGRHKGERAKALVVAKNLLPLLDDGAIAAAAGLSAEEVARLRGQA